MEIEKLQEIKNNIDEAKSEKDQALGAIEQIKKKWKEEFDCKDEKEVQSLISTYEDQIKKLDDKYKKLTDEIESKIKEIE